MIRWQGMCVAVAAFVLLAGCNRSAEPGVAAERRHVPDESPVVFDLEPRQGGEGAQQWIGIYNSQGKTARFRMDFGPAESTPGKNAGDASIRSGEGTLIPEPGSDSSSLLVELQKALRAQTAPQAPAAKTSVPFTYVNLGENLSQSDAGKFNANPPGNWTAMKLIFGDGARESEIFLHINASNKKGQFSMKDPAKGDLLLAELAKVL